MVFEGAFFVVVAECVGCDHGCEGGGVELWEVVRAAGMIVRVGGRRCASDFVGRIGVDRRRMARAQTVVVTVRGGGFYFELGHAGQFEGHL